jgi:tetratricopeptide (TPR) repeat protein
MAKGDYYFQSGMVAEALIHYQRALRVDPDLVECHFKLGRIFFDQGEYNFAEYHYSRILRDQRNLTYAHLYLDAHFELAYTYYRMAESIDPGSDQNRYIMRMHENIDNVIAAFGPRGRFTNLNRYIEIVPEYYLARAWYLKARLLWDKNRDQEYPNAFERARKYFHDLRGMQRRAENYARAAVKEAECLFFLNRHHTRLRQRSRADAWQSEALSIRNALAAKAAALLANPATAFSEDIAVYRRAAEEIDALFAGRVRIAPLFQFFPLKGE